MARSDRAERYGTAFYRAIDSGAEPSARRVWPMLLELFSILSVVDIGCANGAWLAAAREMGIVDVLGLDGPWIPQTMLKIPAEQFHRVSLDEPVRVDRCFDLAISLEVAEHLPSARAADFVGELTALAPIVLFSAAIPGQGGAHHLNEQWPGYWAGLFADNGYYALDPLRRQLWQEPDIPFWYKQNLLLFANEHALAANPALASLRLAGEPLALVHPDLFRATMRAARPRLGRWLRMAPQAIARSLRRKSAQPLC